MAELWLTNKYSDCLLACADGDVACSKLVLAAASSFLRQELKDPDVDQICLKDFEVEQVKLLVAALLGLHQGERELSECQELANLLCITFDISDSNYREENVFSGDSEAKVANGGRTKVSRDVVRPNRLTRSASRAAKRRKCQTDDASVDSDDSSITSAIRAFERVLDEEELSEQEEHLDYSLDAAGKSSGESLKTEYCSEHEACELAKNFIGSNITYADKPSNRYMCYRCGACGKMLGRHHEKVFFHVLNHLNVSMYKCHVCGHFWQDRSKFERHINTHSLTRNPTKKDKYALLDPGVYGTYNESTKRGVDTPLEPRDGGDFLFECIEACFSQFREKEGIVTTKESAKELCMPYIKLFSKNPTRYKCVKCNYECDATTTLIKHVMIHLNLFLYQCPECGVKINQEGNFERHLNNQHGLTMHEKNAVSFKLVFNMNFVLTGELASKSTRSQEKPAVDECTELNEHYLQKARGLAAGGPKSNAKYYKRNVDLTYECNSCGVVCNTGKLIKRHILEAHGQKFPFPCEICDETFSSEGYLKIHSAHHKNQPATEATGGLTSDLKQNEQLEEDVNNIGIFCTPEEAVSLIEPFITVERIEPLTYGCRECEYLSDSRHSVRQHLYQHFNIYMYKCTCCRQLSRTRKQHESHMLTHGLAVANAEGREGCAREGGALAAGVKKVLPKEFLHFLKSDRFIREEKARPLVETYYARRDAQSLYTDEGQAVCKVCSAEGSVYEVHNHVVEQHLKVFQFKCSICGRKIRSDRQFQAHMKEEHNMENFVLEKSVYTEEEFEVDVEYVGLEVGTEVDIPQSKHESSADQPKVGGSLKSEGVQQDSTVVYDQVFDDSPALVRHFEETLLQEEMFAENHDKDKGIGNLLLNDDPMWKQEAQAGIESSTLLELKSKKIYLEDATEPLLKAGSRKLEKVLTGQLYSQSEADSLLVRNIVRNQTTKEWECVVCNGEFRTKHKTVMRTHVFDHFKVFLYQCDRCKDMFRSETTYQTHVQAHTRSVSKSAKVLESLEDEMIGNYHLIKSYVFVPLERANVIIDSYIRYDVSKHNFSCKLCSEEKPGKSVVREHLLRAHLKIHRYRCDLCQEGFSFKAQIKKHTERVHKEDYKEVENPFKTGNSCVVDRPEYHSQDTDFPGVKNILDVPKEELKGCKVSTEQGRKIMKAHVMKNQDDNMYECELCDYRRLNASQIQCHVLTHHYDVYMYVCPVKDCGMKLRNWGRYTMHEKSHAGTKRKAPVAQTYTIDEEFHLLKEPVFVGKEEGHRIARSYFYLDGSTGNYKCKLCKYSNKHQRVEMHALAVHLSMVNMFMCEHCGKYFRYNEQRFRDHVNEHVQGKYQCQTCIGMGVDVRKKFTKASLAAHIKRIHRDGEFACQSPGCGYLASTVAVLRQHEKDVHGIGVVGKAFQCPICGHAFPRKGRYEKHVRSCETGRSRISFRKRNLDSLEWLGKGAYRCKLCDALFQKDPSSKTSLKQARSHLVSDHGMQHLKGLKMDWVVGKKDKEPAMSRPVKVGQKLGTRKQTYENTN